MTPLPYTVHFSDPTVAVLHGQNVFPSSDDSTLQLRYTVPGDYELTLVSNDFTRAAYKWKVKVRNGTPVTKLNANGPLFLRIGETNQCRVTFNEGKNIPDNTEVIWSSDNEDVIKIDENGNVTAIGEGTVLITARSADPACSDIFAEHQIIVTAAGVTSFTVPQIKAESNTCISYNTIKTKEIQTEFHVGIIPGSDNTGIITAPSVNLSSDGTVPQTPYNFGYKGRECIQQYDAIKLMSSPVIDLDLILYGDLTGRAEAVRTPLVIPTQFNVSWDGRLGTIDIVKIGDYAFAGSNIEYAHIPKFVLAGESGTTRLTELGNYVFAECHSYKGLTEGSAYDVVPDFITKMGRGVFKNCDKMEIMSIGDGIT
ncbi:MAG: Ig-like domain-containing protein, partial [Paramuribaculum sp.]|nr:Ig-like domain-containing protein [Paramuribaculum sp.]